LFSETEHQHLDKFQKNGTLNLSITFVPYLLTRMNTQHPSYRRSNCTTNGQFNSGRRGLSTVYSKLALATLTPVRSIHFGTLSPQTSHGHLTVARIYENCSLGKRLHSLSLIPCLHPILILMFNGTLVRWTWEMGWTSAQIS
jgi:hypothetical protein